MNIVDDYDDNDMITNIIFITNIFIMSVLTGTTFSRFWQIRVDQIPCGTLYTPPQVMMMMMMMMMMMIMIMAPSTPHPRAAKNTTWSHLAT